MVTLASGSNAGGLFCCFFVVLLPVMAIVAIVAIALYPNITKTICSHCGRWFAKQIVVRVRCPYCHTMTERQKLRKSTSDLAIRQQELLEIMEGYGGGWQLKICPHCREEIASPVLTKQEQTICCKEQYVVEDSSPSSDTLSALGIGKYKYSYCCPECYTSLELKMRVTQKQRYCPTCRHPITVDEIDRQRQEALDDLEESGRSLRSTYEVLYICRYCSHESQS